MSNDPRLAKIEAKLRKLLASDDVDAPYHIQRIGGQVHKIGGLALLDEMADRIDPTSRLSWLWWESFGHKPLLDELVGHARRVAARDDEARIGEVLLAVGGWERRDQVSDRPLWGDLCDADQVGATMVMLEDVLDAPPGEHQIRLSRLLLLRLVELGGVPLARCFWRKNPTRRDRLHRVWARLLEGGSDE